MFHPLFETSKHRSHDHGLGRPRSQDPELVPDAWLSLSACLSCITGWWFGTFLFSHILGIIIPIDFHIFQRGGPTTNQIRMAHLFGYFPCQITPDFPRMLTKMEVARKRLGAIYIYIVYCFFVKVLGCGLSNCRGHMCLSDNGGWAILWAVVHGEQKNGGFHKWGIPNSWLVYFMDNSMNMDDLGVPPISGNPPYGKMILETIGVMGYTH